MAHHAAEALKSFLEHASRPAGTLRYHELQGFLFAIACAPDLVPPSEWMPVVFGDHEPEYESVDEARTIIGELMAAYNRVNADVAEDHAVLPLDCVFRADPIANLDASAPVAQWARGFLRGHQWLEELWEQYVPAELDDEFAAILMTLSFFASKDLAAAFCAESGGSDVADMASTMAPGSGRASRSAAMNRVHAAVDESTRNVAAPTALDRSGERPNDPSFSLWPSRLAARRPRRRLSQS